MYKVCSIPKTFPSNFIKQEHIQVYICICDLCEHFQNYLQPDINFGTHKNDKTLFKIVGITLKNISSSVWVFINETKNSGFQSAIFQTLGVLISTSYH